MKVLWLKHLGYQHKEIAVIAGIHHDTVTKYYQEGGIEKVQHLAYQNSKSILDNSEDLIKEEFNKKPPQTLNEAVMRIEQLTGIKRKKSAVHTFMRKLGFKKLKTAQVPAKADPKKQKDFLDKSLKPKLEEAKQGKRAVLFMDSVHFVHAVFLGMLWCLTSPSFLVISKVGCN